MNIAEDEQYRTGLDAAVKLLVSNRQKWARTTVNERIQILNSIKDCLLGVSEDWVMTAARKKQIPEGSPLVGEEWTSGPYSVMAACNAFIETLGQMDGKGFLDGLPVRKISASQIGVRVLPRSIWDRLLLSGITAEVWMQEGVTKDNLAAHTATAYDVAEADRDGSVSLVLGAGNIASIAPLDCFHKLFIEHSTVILKMNPVNDYLADFLEVAFEPLVSFGALQIVRGGADVGAYLCEHPDIESIHITGAGASHDAIVWGTGEEAQRNRQAGTPRISKTITSELGAVCPTIVVPGPWSQADIRFQAENVATQKLHNSGFNCIACQMLVMPESWQQAEQFLDTLNQTMADAPKRGLYYPGASDRMDQFRKEYPENRNLSSSDDPADRVVVPFSRSNKNAYAEEVEVFAPLMSITNVSGDDAESYLRNAITYCNEHLHGTLGANIIIHPGTKRALAEKWDSIVAELKYGCIAVNGWTALGFLTVQTPWGAFPGHTLEDVQSGIGFVHNTYMFDRPQRTLIEAPFWPFPRNLLHGSWSLLPRPPWFVTNKKADVLGRLLTRFQHNPGFGKIPRIFMNALLG